MINLNDELDIILQKVNKSILEICFIIRRNNPMDLSSVLGKDIDNKIIFKDIYCRCTDLFYNNLKNIQSIKYISFVDSKDLILLNVKGSYFISIDPIFNFENLDSLYETGTIFSVFEYDNNKIDSGNNIVMAGYSLYNIYTQLIICKYGRTDIYELSLIDEKWKLVFPNYKIKDKGSIYSIDESLRYNFDINLRNLIDNLNKEKYKFIWSGSILSDFNKIITKSGLLVIPECSKNLIYLIHHAYPLSYIIEKSNGLSYSNKMCVLNLKFPINDLLKKVSISIGSEYEIFNLIDINTK